MNAGEQAMESLPYFRDIVAHPRGSPPALAATPLAGFIPGWRHAQTRGNGSQIRIDQLTSGH